MRLLNSEKPRYIYTIKQCHKCRHNNTYADNTSNPQNNQTTITCKNCGHTQPVYGTRYNKPKAKK